ncbi:sensor histidine kinase [Amycolatopsis taiwanensis]|uniref:sensor histidine kinase n=1 Tax=Amycolatopsis taiwanensis TaxID=342230 RepID=UPI0004AFD64B|nr:sensor histidine kinase [Amycolatopsis taiwanensis]
MDGLRGRIRLTGWGALLFVMSIVGIGVWICVVAAGSLVTVFVGVPLTLITVGWLRGLANWHRQWSAEKMGVEIERPYRPIPEGSLATRFATVAKDRATYRDLQWALVNSTAGLTLSILPFTMLAASVFYLSYPLLFTLTPPDVFRTPFGPWFTVDFAGSFAMCLLAPVWFGLFWWTTPALMRAYTRLTRTFLAPDEKQRLALRVAQLTESRAETVDAQAVELRRIERDLHDGAQARLVSLGMSLGMAETLLASNPDAAGELLAEARKATGLALSELRDLVRGIHPPVLADRGLDGAVRALALASPLPVEVSVDLPGRAPAPVESAVYFAVAEALTNAAKHSAASSAWVRLTYTDGRLGAMVGDDGRGGATQNPGGGLHGVERRLAAFDGTLVLASPVGGPTIVTMELPCVLSLAKTSPSSEMA